MSVERSTALLENIDSGIVFQFLNEGNTYPYALAKPCKGIAIDNCSTSAELTVVLTYRDNATTITIPVPVGTTYNGTFEDFINVTASGATPFDIEVRR